MRKLVIALLCMVSMNAIAAEKAPFITNVYGRNVEYLNGKWDAIVDLFDLGHNRRLYLDQKASKPSEFFEYSWQGGLQLDVPGDWNHQSPELKFYEGTVWYSRHFTTKKEPLLRQFLYFGAVSYRCNVYLNGMKIASHEGSFTPFQVEITKLMNDGDNFLVLEVSNRRTKDAIPALSYDWWSYGGITRDVMLVTLPKVFVYDYSVSLDKKNPETVNFSIQLSNAVSTEVRWDIPELKIHKTFMTDSDGYAECSAQATNLERWSPDSPRLYDVHIKARADRVVEKIGFRNLSVDGTKILLNGKPVFLRCVSFHEEIAPEMRRAVSQEDAEFLITHAVALGVNAVRLAHYPQNEYIERFAEKMGVMIWEEIPLWQGIDFSDPSTRAKAMNMYKEMVYRDRNRCAVSVWGIANETKPGAERDAFLTDVLNTARSLDDTRLFGIADDVANYNPESGLFEMDDPFIEKLDVVGVNKYLGWYAPWPLEPEKCVWNVAPGKPLIITEFGCEAMFGNNGDAAWADSWGEDYQARLYRDNLRMFENIPNLAGVSPWVLFDFRSPYRFHPTKQEGWNRKGLLSDKGERKKAWYIMNDYYRKIRQSGK